MNCLNTRLIFCNFKIIRLLSYKYVVQINKILHENFATKTSSCFFTVNEANNKSDAVTQPQVDLRSQRVREFLREFLI